MLIVYVTCSRSSRRKLLNGFLFSDSGKKYSKAQSIDDLEDWIERFIIMDLKSAPFDTKDEKLYQKAGSCLTCPKRTGFNTSLFPDLVKDDSCTDPVCFNTKVYNNINKVVENLKEKKFKSIHLISDKYQVKDKAVLSSEDYKVINPGMKSCDKMAVGVLKEAWNIKDLGKVKKICLDKNCKEHWGSSNRGLSKKSDTEKQAEALKRKKIKTTTNINFQILKTASEKIKIKGRDNKPVLLHILDHIFDRIWFNSEGVYFLAHPEFKEKYSAEEKDWKGKSKYSNTATFKRMLSEYFPALKEQELLSAIFEFSFIQDLDPSNLRYRNIEVDKKLIKTVNNLKLLSPGEINKIKKTVQKEESIQKKEKKEVKKPAPKAAKKGRNK